MAVELIDEVSRVRDLSAAERRLVECFTTSRQYFGNDASPIHADVIRQLCLHAGLVSGGPPAWLRIDGATIEGPLDLSGIRIDFPLRFRNCALERLELTDARLISLEMHGGTCGAIVAGRVHVAHGVVLSAGFRATGRVRFPDASIGGDLNCRGATFDGEKGASALLFDGARIEGRVYLQSERSGEKRPFLAQRGVSGQGARVAGSMNCERGHFAAELDLRRISVGRSLRLVDASVASRLTLRCAHVSSDIDVQRATLDGDLVDLDLLRCEGTLTWKDVRRTARGKLTVDLTGARVAALADDHASWHGATMKLDGFSFDAVAVDMPRTDRMRWLDSQPDGTWSAYPYDQTIRALRSSGYEADARAIAIERERRRRKNGRLGLGRAVNWAFGALLGYGYRPFYAVAWALACVLVGWALLSDEHEVAKTTPVPDFRAFGFALDAFLPISLGQTDAYVMRGANDEIVVWALTGAGWLLTALLVAALTGLLRKD